MRLGIDEAGRGPILGPMVLAGVYCDAAQERVLVESGVRDSKRFTGKSARPRRAALAERIRSVARTVVVRVIPPARIDAENLGTIERREAMAILREVRPTGAEILFDGASIFGSLARKLAGGRAEDRAEDRHPVVAAASIVAKAERDRRFLEIASRYEPDFGPIRGWGYNNEGSYALIRWHEERFGAPPPEMRRKWRRG